MFPFRWQLQCGTAMLSGSYWQFPSWRTLLFPLGALKYRPLIVKTGTIFWIFWRFCDFGTLKTFFIVIIFQNFTSCLYLNENFPEIKDLQKWLVEQSQEDSEDERLSAADLNKDKIDFCFKEMQFIANSSCFLLLYLFWIDLLTIKRLNKIILNYI